MARAVPTVTSVEKFDFTSPILSPPVVVLVFNLQLCVTLNAITNYNNADTASIKVACSKGTNSADTAGAEMVLGAVKT